MPYKDLEVRKQKVSEYGKKWRQRPEVKERLAELGKEWSANHRKDRVKYVQEYRKRNPEKVADYKKKYNSENNTKINETRRKYIAVTKEKHQEYERLRAAKRKADPVAMEKRKAQQRAYYERNRDKRIAAVSEYQTKNVDKLRPGRRVRAANRKSRQKNNGGVFTLENWIGRFDYYGRRCAYCTKTLDSTSVEIDHIKPVARGGSNWPSNLSPACPTCNMRKGTKAWSPQSPKPRTSYFQNQTFEESQL